MTDNDSIYQDPAVKAAIARIAHEANEAEKYIEDARAELSIGHPLAAAYWLRQAATILESTK